ncbi:Diacetyl reductase [Sphaceloma murrayae]|uniref:Diacetyl reductase n=1 Tax=Sphaceloma murrayae TaxID=2082308 RepID=A0A2K1QMA7_9PEZI|nr:Diacetyl reductase [Sphaceloma murrayae]
MASKHLTGRIITITGAASGIGRATAIRLANRGASLALADVSEAPLAGLTTELKGKHPGSRFLANVVDIGDSVAVDNWISQTAKVLGPLSGAANIAGILIPEEGGFANLNNNAFEKTIRINLVGLMYCLRAQLKVMADGGSIVNASSMGGLIGFPGLAAYAASKAGVISLSKSAAKDAGSRGIRVNAIAPGGVETPMLKTQLDAMAAAHAAGDTTSNATLAIQRLATPDEIAGSIEFLLGDDSRYITGETLRIDGGALA